MKGAIPTKVVRMATLPSVLACRRRSRRPASPARPDRSLEALGAAAAAHRRDVLRVARPLLGGRGGLRPAPAAL